MKYHQIDLSGLKTYSAKDRQSKAAITSAAAAYTKGSSFSEFIVSLPGFLAASDIKAVASAVVRAREKGRPVVLGMGAHPIKVGLSPLIIDLIDRQIVTALACNGACIIHDFEMAFMGQTSEDVAAELGNGSFGMAKETGQILNRAINEGVASGAGIGTSIGRFIDSSGFEFCEKSIFRAGFRKDIPMSVHVAVGADIIHMHKEADGAAIGEGSLRDFRLFASVVADLEAGVYINLGSAVIMPEVFLKALSVARNLGNRVDEFTTVNMDFIQHYRPRENVLKRPTLNSGKSYALTGHHELMLPLLCAMIIEKTA
ncbi:MAG: hypothetical protein RBT37_00340 [Dissulfurispiraceae bacterium]|jgi:hypothetical protein|nr:hypothetical protein [Dissulfurispiraceae bacterium]